MTTEERSAIIERGAKRILEDWPELMNREIAMLISERLWELWEKKLKN